MYQYAIAKLQWHTLGLNKCHDIFHGCVPNLITISAEEYHSTWVRHNNFSLQYFKTLQLQKMWGESIKCVCIGFKSYK